MLVAISVVVVVSNAIATAMVEMEDLRVEEQRGQVEGGAHESAARHCDPLLDRSLADDGDVARIGLGIGKGPRVCVAAVPSRRNPSDFDIVVLCEYALHQVSVHRPRKQKEQKLRLQHLECYQQLI